MATEIFETAGTLSTELGETTYVEFIYAQRQTIHPTTRTVPQALPQLAYKQHPGHGSHDPSANTNIVPTQQHFVTYTQTGDLPQAHRLVALPEVSNLIVPQDITCAVTTTAPNCSTNGCQLDLVFLVDTAIDLTKIRVLADTLAAHLTAAEVSYRFGLIAFDTTVATTEFLLDVGCLNAQTYATFVAALNDLSPTTTISENASTEALELAASGSIGLWRTNAIKTTLLITNESPATDPTAVLATYITCDLKIAVINSNADNRSVLQDLTTQTTGAYFETNTNYAAYVIPYLDRLCNPLESSATDPTQNCDTKLSFDQFESRGAWAGGTVINGIIRLSAPTGSDYLIQQTYFELISGTLIHLTLDCITTGGIIVEFIYGSSNIVDQYFGATIAGTQHFVSAVPPGISFLTLRIRAQTTAIDLDNILVCSETPANCLNNITNIRTYIKWNGITRYPANFFNLVLRYTYRSLTNPLEKTIVSRASIQDGRLSTVTPTGCGGPTTLDFWKQQGNMGMVEEAITNRYLTNLDAINPGTVVDLWSRTNWLWAIPASATGVAQDALVTLWDDPPALGLLESIQVLYLANIVNATEPISSVCAGPFNANDPADTFSIMLRYKNNGHEREFSTSIAKALLYHTNDTALGLPWDTISALGNGLKGPYAQWQAKTFLLDSIDGSGLDQCTIPLVYRTTGSGTLRLPSLELSGSAQALLACESTVAITELTKGVTISELQSIVLPNSTGGRWILTVNFSGSFSASIPWNVTARQLQLYLSGYPNIHSLSNVDVTGAGTSADPFMVEFKGALAGRDIPPMTIDASGLVGTGSAAVTRVSAGSTNERQLITKQAATGTPLIAHFLTANSGLIQYNASLIRMQQALEAITTVGFGNVSVSGETTDIYSQYEGPWTVEFVGRFTGQNVPSLTTSSAGYRITTLGNLFNEIQKITVIATSGTFYLTIPNPNPTGGSVDTAPMAYNVAAATVAAAMVAAAPWLVGNLKVTKLPHDPAAPTQIEWTVEFKGAYAGQALELMTAHSNALDELHNSHSIITEVRKGGGTRERQKVEVIDSNFGTYKLQFNFGGELIKTNAIGWNADVGTIISILNDIFPYEGDVTVTETTSTNPKTVFSYIVSFHSRFGDVELMAMTDSTLTCDPLILSSNPPYKYELPRCSENIPNCNIECNPGPILCKPVLEDQVPAAEPCCVDTTSGATELRLERQLSAPTGASIRSLAAGYGLKPSQYNAYTRNFKTNALTQISLSSLTVAKMSIVLIPIDEDSAQTRRRIMLKLQTSPNILPARMSWDLL